MKAIDAMSRNYIEYNVNSNDKDPKFKVGDHVRISKHKSSFAKGYTPNWSEEVLLLTKLKMRFKGHILSMILIAKKLLEHFVKKKKSKRI